MGGEARRVNVPTDNWSPPQESRAGISLQNSKRLKWLNGELRSAPGACGYREGQFQPSGPRSGKWLSRRDRRGRSR